MRLITFFLVVFCLLFVFASRAYAIYDPLSVPNNRFGIHIGDPVDLPDAANLVNSSGGDWGYVTFVIQKTERDPARWQKVFDSARRFHLIPIVRIATRDGGGKWEKPDLGEIDGWVSFLSSLNWVIKNRYVVIGNEPNHAEEWGGEVNPEEYATYLSTFSQKLKAASSDFFVLPAGFDASAPNSKTSMDETLYLQRMLQKEPDVFRDVDGWTSHSYPNPAFSGSENGTGKGSVRTYQWELSYLRSLGVNKDFPVFITETGWAHKVAGENSKLLSPDQIGSKFIGAFANAWNNKKVVAVTPFILKYNEMPFDIFSWKDSQGNFYSFYNDVKGIQKNKGEPIQEVKGEILAVFVSPVHLTDGTFTGIAFVENTGQAVWSDKNISLRLSGTGFTLLDSSMSSIEPGGEGVVTFRVASPHEGGFYKGEITLTSQGREISNTGSFEIYAITSLRMQIDLIFAKIRSFLGISSRRDSM